MRLSRKALDAYNAAIKKQGGNAERAARAALDEWFAESPGASIAETREFCITLMQELGTLYGGKAGDAAYALRSMIADACGVDVPDIDYAYAPDPEHVGETARYQVEKLKGGDVDGFSKAIGDAARYFAERGANDTMATLGRRDGERARFARVPTGATTCPYCCMLASRGFVYRSELSALNANHRHCDCRIVEGFDGMDVEGYDPDEYYDRWKHPEKYEDESIDDVVSNQGVSFDLAGVKKSANTEKVINKLKSEYNSPLQTVSLFPPQIALERNRDGQVDLFTGTVMFLKRGDDVIATHEFAHTLWSTKRMEEYKTDNSAAFEKELRKLWRAYRKDQSSNAQISSYSRENIDEFLAEGFSAYKTGKPADSFGSSGNSPYAKAIGELVDKYFKKK